MLLTKHFADALPVLNQIEKNGHKAYFVGGCVRDLLLGRELGDIDIATSAPPDFIQKIFNKVIPVGIEHGTVIVQNGKNAYEVTTFREEGDYSDQRHPDSVQFLKTIDGDLTRRDFTINAMAMDKHGDIIDLFGGREDINRKVIRTVGNGFDRFMEDPLRVIRALRFSSQLGFSISDEALQDIVKVKQEIENIAVERISNEMDKLFAGNHINTGIKYLNTTKVYEHLPVMVKYPYIMEKLPEKLSPLQSFGAVIAMFHYVEPDVGIKQWVREWKCSNKVRREAVIIHEGLTNYKQEGLDPWTVYSLPERHFADFAGLVNSLIEKKPLLTIDELKSVKSNLPINSTKELTVSGNDVRELFPKHKGGPWIQQTLEAVERQVVSGRLANNKKALKDWIKWNPQGIN